MASPEIIGTPGVAWGMKEKQRWLDAQIIKRSYHNEVVEKLLPLASPSIEIKAYGKLLLAPKSYPLYAARTTPWVVGKPIALITGGVHGYETSGVQGAIRFIQEHMDPVSIQDVVW